MLKNKICDTYIFHHRKKPFDNFFSYNALSLLLNLKEIKSLKKPFLFSINKPNIFSFYEIELALDSQIFTNGDMQYKLVPGVQVHIFILTGERTILSYVTTPFHNSVGQALQER